MPANFDCDLLVIGLGPAGMAATIMGHSMGLKVIAVEQRSIGGECLNVGCIPSKALLKTAKIRQTFEKLKELGLSATEKPRVRNPFKRVREVVGYVGEQKTAKMFEGIDLVLGQGSARFVDSHTVELYGGGSERKICARKVFICVGTRPKIPDISGIGDVPLLTNENLFELDAVPKRLIVIGGGAIGCEMGQAISRLGAKVTILNSSSQLLPRADREAGELLAREFISEGIELLNDVKIKELRNKGDGVVSVYLDDGQSFSAERLLVAAGRLPALEGLQLEKAGVAYNDSRGIAVDPHLRTTQRHIFAPGDCNGYRLFSHAAMHQGMLALINAMSPFPFKRRYKKYCVPWSVFTEPEVSQVGETEAELKARGARYEVVRVDYGDYGRAVADASPVGFVKVFCSPLGRIYGAAIAGECSSELIGEFAFAIQSGKRLTSILFLQHSFPTLSFLNKRIAETWLMKKVKDNRLLHRLVAKMFRLF